MHWAKNLPEQMIAAKKTASAIVDLIEAGNEVVIAHGNGPQVGMIQNAMSEADPASNRKDTFRVRRPYAWL